MFVCEYRMRTTCAQNGALGRKSSSAISHIRRKAWFSSSARAGTTRNADTRRLPAAMHSTNSAATIEKVNGEEPSESAPIRFSTVWTAIMEKPVRKATLT